MESLFQDLRYAVRMLIRTPGFTVVAVISLALGVGANTSIFSVIDAVLLRPFPFKEPARLLVVHQSYPKPNGDFSDSEVWSYPKFAALRDRSRQSGQLAGFCAMGFALADSSGSERLAVELVSADYFQTLGIEPQLGRFFFAEEDITPGTHPVAVLGHGLWQRRFGSDPSVIGKTISLNKVTLTVVGILPEGFRGLSARAEAWAPLMMTPALMDNPRRLQEPGANWLQIVARPYAGVTVSQFQWQIKAAAEQARSAVTGPVGPRNWGAKAVTMTEANIDPAVRSSLLVLLCAVGSVLLIACANVANLLTARAASREGEIAVRLALGAGRGRLIRQMLTESLLLALLGGIVGLLLALWGIDVLAAFKPGTEPINWGGRSFRMPNFNPIRLNGPVLLFNFLIAMVTGLLFGLLPSLEASRPDLNESLKAGPQRSRYGMSSLRRISARSVLVVAETALALVLLIGAVLMIRSFALMKWTHSGFEPRNVLTMRMDLPREYTQLTAVEFYRRLLDNTAAIPGVDSAALGSSTPLTRMDDIALMKTAERPEEMQQVGVHVVSSDFFRTLQVPLLQGRTFSDRDRIGTPWVALINQTAARRYWPGENPISRRISLTLWSPDHELVEVVGIVGDVKYGRIEEVVQPDVYLSCMQYMYPSSFLLLRAADTASAASGVRRLMAAQDRNIPLYDIKTMEERIGDVTARIRFSAVLLGIFATLALILAAVGIYGVMAFSVTRRFHEIGVRMALGAQQRDVLRMVLGDGLLLASVGVALGLVGAYLATGVLANQLYGVTATDSSTFAVVALLLAAVVLLASYLPARRATKVDPMVALRYE